MTQCNKGTRAWSICYLATSLNICYEGILIKHTTHNILLPKLASDLGSILT